MKFKANIFFVSLIALMCCAQPESKETKDVAAKAKPYAAGTHYPQNCLGTVALDKLAHYAVAGPNFLRSVPSRREKYSAYGYFSGELFSEHNIAKNYDKKNEDNFFGHSVALTYQAMCEKNLNTLQRFKNSIPSLMANVEKENNTLSHVSAAKAKQMARLLNWELEFALAKITNSKEQLLYVQEALANYVSIRKDGAGQLYMDAYNATSKKENNRFSKINQIRLELLQTNINIQAALYANNREMFFDSFSQYRKLSTRLEKGNKGRGYPWYFYSHGTTSDADHFLKAAVLYHRMNAWTELLDNKDFHPKYGFVYKDSVPYLKNFNFNKRAPRGLDLQHIGRDFERTSRGLSNRLNYEDSPLLWALHQNLRYQFYKKLAMASAEKTMVYNKELTAAGVFSKTAAPKTPPNLNTDYYCYSYRAYFLAKKILPLNEDPQISNHWCR